MRHLQSEFHFRHALFALQGPDGYVEALLTSARETTTPPPPSVIYQLPPQRAGEPPLPLFTAARPRHRLH
ncbi:MAG: hypothetical protein KGM15_00555 [Pseudomonadota bacterium]|nr:hypothetical protein [Pseudomonadota bacterium]